MSGKYRFLQDKPFPKVIWSFWDKGVAKLPAFNKYNIGKWREIVNDSWDVVVVSMDPDDACYFQNFVSDDLLPKNFHQLEDYISDFDRTSKPVVQSDHIRLALLEKYGGLWMDSSNVVLKHPDDMFAAKLLPQSSSKEIAGYVNIPQSTNENNHLDGFENWFIAARRNSTLIKKWRNSFTMYWETKKQGEDIINHPMYKNKIDLTYISPQLRNYLNQHAALAYTLHQYPSLKEVFLTLDAKGPFGMAAKHDWDAEAIYEAVVVPKLFQNSLDFYLRTPTEFYKFPSIQLKNINKTFTDIEMFYRCDNVFQYLHAHLF